MAARGAGLAGGLVNEAASLGRYRHLAVLRQWQKGKPTSKMDVLQGFPVAAPKGRCQDKL